MTDPKKQGAQWFLPEFFEQKVQRYKFAGYIISLILFCGLIYGSVMISRAYQKFTQLESERRFQAEAARIVDTVDEFIKLYVTQLYDIQAFFLGSDVVSEQEWQLFVQSGGFQQRYPGRRSTRYIQRVERAGLEAFTDTINAEERYRGGNFKVYPETVRDEYYVVRFTTGDPGVIGFDLLSEPERARTAHLARDTGQLVTTGRTIIQTDPLKRYGFITMLPSYRQGMPLDTVEQRRAAFVGLHENVFVAEDFFNELIPPDAIDQDLGATIYLHMPGGQDAEQSAYLLTYNKKAVDRAQSAGGMEYGIDIPLAQGHLRVSFYTYEGFGLDAVQRLLPTIVLIVGLVAATLLTVVFVLLWSTRYRAYKIVGEVSDQLRATLSRLAIQERALEAADDGILITDPQQEDNPIVYCNEAFLRITGYSPQEVLGRNCRFLNEKDHNQPEVAQLREGIAANRPTRVTLRNFKKDGTMFWNETSIAPVFDDTGALINFVGVVHDASERKQVEENLRRRSAELETLNKAMVGRELKMQELKKKLADLGSKNGDESAS